MVTMSLKSLDPSNVWFILRWSMPHYLVFLSHSYDFLFHKLLTTLQSISHLGNGWIELFHNYDCHNCDFLSDNCIILTLVFIMTFSLYSVIILNFLSHNCDILCHNFDFLYNYVFHLIIMTIS